VPDPDAVLFLAAPRCLLAYGPAPGVELIPYFFSLLGWVGLALAAVLLSPLAALLRRLRKARGGPPAAPRDEPTTAPESPREGSHDAA
jgi:hypothetical protein